MKTKIYSLEKKKKVCSVIESIHFNLNEYYIYFIIYLGNEGSGVSQNILNLCDSLISIEPAQSLPNGIDSLNVSVATGNYNYFLLTVTIETPL